MSTDCQKITISLERKSLHKDKTNLPVLSESAKSLSETVDLLTNGEIELHRGPAFGNIGSQQSSIGMVGLHPLLDIANGSASKAGKLVVLSIRRDAGGVFGTMGDEPDVERRRASIYDGRQRIGIESELGVGLRCL